MTFIIPSSVNELISQSRTDVQRELVDSNPFLAQGWLSALITAQSNRVFDVYSQLEGALDENFPDTSTGIFLERWAAVYGIGRLPGAAASGNLIATGIVGSIIDVGSLYQSSDSIVYAVTTFGTIIAFSGVAITSIVRVGNTATVTTPVDHGLSSNVLVTISDAVEAEYNGVGIVITAISANTFSYEVSNTPATPATDPGSILLAFDIATIAVEAQTFGVSTNQIFNTQLALQSPIAGVDNQAGVDSTGLIDGLDQETDESLQSRLLDRLRNPVAHFNVADITSKAKEVVGVTRVFVQEVTPSLGQVTIYFMRDNDDDPIPSASEVLEVKNKILTIKPANTASVDVIVLAPTAVATAFTFSAIFPDTITMRIAVEADLNQFFSEETNLETNVTENAYLTAIQNTVDTVNGDRLVSFTLSAPLGDIIITSGEIATLGTVTFT